MRGTAESVMERADVLALFSESTGEITRPYGTRSLRDALDAAAGWLTEAGMSVRRDAIGNVIGRRGADELPTLLLGSHLDSVRDAGRYDGPLGVLVAVAAAERLAADELPFAVEVVVFADEEGLRFKSSYLGSRAYAGLLDEADLELIADDGEPLADAVRAMGGDPAEACSGAGVDDRLLGYLEVHIEQGPVLEAEGLPVGVVTAIAGQSRGFVEVIGEAGHAGNTPPDLRRDALCGAAELVLGLEATMRDEPGLIATVGRVEVSPNVGNVIPGRVTLSYDVRHQDDVHRVAAIADLAALTAAICERRGLRHELRPLQDHPAVAMSPRLRRLLVRAVESVGVVPRELPSGAGHDAVSLSHLTGVAMLFVRCKGGVSHHPDESVERADVAVAIEVVEAFLRLLADEVDAG